MLSAMGSTSWRCRATTRAQGCGDRAACLFGGLTWSGGEAAWHRRRDRPLVLASERTVMPATALRPQLQDSDRAETAHIPLLEYYDTAELNRPTSPALAGYAAGSGEATSDPRPGTYAAGCAGTYTETALCGAVQAGSGFTRGFPLTRSLTHSILTLLSSSPMSWSTAATGVP